MSYAEDITRNHASYRPVPWWCWTGGLASDHLRQQLHLMYEQGIREFFIFPLYGLEVEYMSEEYLQAVGRALEWSRQLGMKVWIYDEYNWPSGTAGGRVPRYHPEAIAWGIVVERHENKSFQEADKLISDPAVLHACIQKPNGKVESVKKGITKNTPLSNLTVYRLERDKTQQLVGLGSLWSKGESGMLDILSSAACRRFIDEAYEPIAKRFLQYFGSTLTGFFTDEIEFSWGTIIPWTTGFQQTFRREYGYDLIDRIHDLTFDTPTSDQTRIDYWSLATRISSEVSTGQIAAWCEKHGLVLTGHMIDEETSNATIHHGDTWAHLRKMQAPGCDMLFLVNNFDGPECHAGRWYKTPSSLIKTPKLASSSARFAGRKRVMCEAFGVPAWSRTMADEKRQADWLAALGINLINDNLLVTDIWGFRKRLVSGKHFTQPWWKYAHLFYEYAGRLCALFAETTLSTELAVLFPTTTWWACTRIGQGKSERANRLEDVLDVTLESLVLNHWDFELIFEDVIAQSKVSDGKLITGQGDFRTILLAGIDRLPKEVKARLEELTASGGHVINIDAQPDILKYLDKTLSECTSRNWTIRGQGSDGVISSARTDSTGRLLLFLSNQTPGEKELQVGWQGSWKVELWELENNQRWRSDQEAGKCRLILPEETSVVMVQSPEEPVKQPPPVRFISFEKQKPDLVLEGPWTFRPEPANTYCLNCRLKPDLDGPLVPQVDSSWTKVDWGDAGIRLEPEKMKHYWLYAQFNITHRIDDLRLIVDSPEIAQGFLNDKPLGESENTIVWDVANRGWKIGKEAKIGQNRILLKVRTTPYYSPKIQPGWIFSSRFTEPVLLQGSFAAFETEASDVELRPLSQTISIGDWCGQGFGHFAGTGIYEQTFTWSGPEGQAVIVCDTGKNVTQVRLDGKDLGVRAWEPRRFGIDKLGVGKHRIEVRVANTLAGFLRYSHYAGKLLQAPPAGLLSSVGIFALEPGSYFL
jgi:hypothetical protein